MQASFLPRFAVLLQTKKKSLSAEGQFNREVLRPITTSLTFTFYLLLLALKAQNKKMSCWQLACLPSPVTTTPTLPRPTISPLHIRRYNHAWVPPADSHDGRQAKLDSLPPACRCHPQIVDAWIPRHIRKHRLTMQMYRLCRPNHLPRATSSGKRVTHNLLLCHLPADPHYPPPTPGRRHR